MKTIILSSLLMTIAAEAPAFSQPIIIEDTAAPSVGVQVDDLNLQSEAGRQALDQRIRHAADALCFEPGKTDLARVGVMRKCQQTALASARLRIRTFDRSAVAVAAATSAVSGR